MGLELQQGANAPLAQHRILVGIGWDAGLPWDIDACAFLIGPAGQVRHDQGFVFYNQAETPCGSLILESDLDSDRRCFRAFLDRVPEDVIKITFTLATEPDGYQVKWAAAQSAIGVLIAGYCTLTGFQRAAK
jgi:stress response protein SCP2